MPNKKNYPKGFSEYSVGVSAPIEPKKRVLRKGNLYKIYSRYDTFELPGGKYQIEDFSTDDGGFDSLTLQGYTEVDNYEYNRQWQKYSTEKQIYDAKLAEWQKLKGQWDEEAKLEREVGQEKMEKAMFNKLKKKYGK